VFIFSFLFKKKYASVSKSMNAMFLNTVLYILRGRIYRDTKESTQDPHKDCSAHVPGNMPTHSGGPVRVEISKEL